MIADIHFQPKYVFAAIDAGCAAVRVNPGNIKAFDDKVGEIARAAADAGVSIRIGVNAGSLDKRLLAKYGKATPEALVESALWEASLFEEHGFRDFKISVKHNDPVVMVRAYELLAEQCDYPLHLGVTEAGPAFQGTIKSAVAFGALLSQGIGDTIRVSLSAPPVEEVKVGLQILESLNLRAAPAGDRLLPVLRARPGGRLHAGREGHRRARGHRGAAAGRRDGLRGERSGRGPRGRPRRGVRQRQGPDLRQGRGHQDRPGVADRRDADRGGDAAGRGDGGAGAASGGAGRARLPGWHSPEWAIRLAGLRAAATTEHGRVGQRRDVAAGAGPRTTVEGKRTSVRRRLLPDGSGTGVDAVRALLRRPELDAARR